MRRAMTNQELLRSKREVTGADVFEAVHVAFLEYEVEMNDEKYYAIITTILMGLFDDDLYKKVHLISENTMRHVESSAKVVIKDVLE